MKQTNSTSYKAFLIFSIAYLVCFSLYYVVTGGYEFMLYTAVLLVVGAILLKTRKVSKLDMLALWLLSIWGFVHMLAGSLPVGDVTLYHWKMFTLLDLTAQFSPEFYLLKFDQVVHFYGFAVAAVVMHQLVAKRVIKGTSAGLLIFVATVASMGLGALNEIIEFIVMITTTNNGVGDIYNLGLDLIVNSVGALCGAIWQQKRHEKKK